MQNHASSIHLWHETSLHLLHSRDAEILCEFEKCLSYETAKERYERQIKSLEFLAELYQQRFLETSKEVSKCYQ